MRIMIDNQRKQICIRSERTSVFSGYMVDCRLGTSRQREYTNIILCNKWFPIYTPISKNVVATKRLKQQDKTRENAVTNLFMAYFHYSTSQITQSMAASEDNSITATLDRIGNYAYRHSLRSWLVILEPLHCDNVFLK